MMRYRNNKSVDATAGNGDRVASAAAAASGAANLSSSKGWSGAVGVSGMAAHGTTSKCPAVGGGGVGGALGVSSLNKPGAVKVKDTHTCMHTHTYMDGWMGAMDSPYNMIYLTF